jgi:hypothetical protein
MIGLPLLEPRAGVPGSGVSTALITRALSDVPRPWVIRLHFGNRSDTVTAAKVEATSRGV